MILELGIWAVALFFLVAWPLAVWIKIGRGEYYPKSMWISALWWAPILWVVYTSGLSPYHLLWMMPGTFLIAFQLDNFFLLFRPGRSGGLISWFIVGLFVVPTLLFFGNERPSQTDSRPSSALTISQLREFANEYNKTLPKHIDSATVLATTSVRSDGTVIYRYSIDANSPMFTLFQNVQDKAEAAVLNAACSDPEALYLLGGVPLLYTYFTSDGDYVGEVEINDATCASRGSI